MIGSFQRNIGGISIYATDDGKWLLINTQSMFSTKRKSVVLTKKINIWQRVADLKIWLIATGNMKSLQ